MMSNPATILVAGAINTDLVATMSRAPAAGETVTGTSFSIHGGGKGANQAVAVARLGGNVALLGAVGHDDFGRARLADLKRDHVGVEWVVGSDLEASGVALILVEQGGENRIAYVPGATRNITLEHALEAFGEVQPGFVLAPNELPEECLKGLFGAARAAGAKVVFNATPDPDLARDLLGDVSTLIVNEGEAAVLLGGSMSSDPREAATRLREMGPGMVVVTLGAAGACATDGNTIVWHRPPDVTAVDSTGAGDTFCGAFVTELTRGVNLSEALQFGVHASAVCVTREGAQSSIPARTEVERSLAGR